MSHPLTTTYGQERRRLLDLAAGLSEADGAIRSTACPEWSVKDLYAHLAGIATDILAGNTAEAATPAWADGHVADRADRTLAQVTEEWATAGAEVSIVMAAIGDAFPLELFIDQWTHEWDIRSALGPTAAAPSDDSVIDHYFEDFARIIAADVEPADIGALTVDVDGRRFDIGAGPAVGRLPLSTFEFGRLTMGRRSNDQIRSHRWPTEDREPYVRALVRWSVADGDVIDPIDTGGG